MSHICSTCKATYKNQSSLSRHNRDKQHGNPTGKNDTNINPSHQNPHQYIYLLQEREFINNNQNVYKIGRTHQERTERFNKYPKGSQLILHISCSDCIKAEVVLLKQFRAQFIHRKDIGNEYFEGSVEAMKELIYVYDRTQKDNEVPFKEITHDVPWRSPISETTYIERTLNALSLCNAEPASRPLFGDKSIRTENGATFVPIGAKWF
jgi:hypothetical protein